MVVGGAILLEINCDADAAALVGPPLKRSCTIDFDSCSCERYMEELNIFPEKKRKIQDISVWEEFIYKRYARKK